jgi:hypothetical protein
MTEKTINILKSLKLGEKYPTHKPLGEQEIEEQGVLSKLYNLEILKRVKYSYSVRNVKYLSKFIELQDFEKLVEYIESESKTGTITYNYKNVAQVNQADFLNLKNTEIKQTNHPKTNEKQQNAIISFIEKFWWQILIPLTVGVLLILIEKGVIDIGI